MTPEEVLEAAAYVVPANALKGRRSNAAKAASRTTICTNEIAGRVTTRKTSVISEIKIVLR